MTNRKRASERSTRVKLHSPGRPRAALRSQQAMFWQLIMQGVSSEEAGVQAGASAPVGSRWFREAGGDCQVVHDVAFVEAVRMKTSPTMPRLKGFRFPREIISYAVWAYHRFALSTADVEKLLAKRGVIVSREAIRLWVNRFGRHFTDCVKRDRPTAADKWHLDEVVIPINSRKYWLWRAIDANGDVLDILVQPQRNAKAARLLNVIEN